MGVFHGLEPIAAGTTDFAAMQFIAQAAINRTATTTLVLVVAVDPAAKTVDVNPYHVRTHVADECVADVLQKIVDALNTDNHDRSDIMTDYFDVGHYVDLHIGRWDRPFVCTNPALIAA